MATVVAMRSMIRCMEWYTHGLPCKEQDRTIVKKPVTICTAHYVDGELDRSEKKGSYRQ